MNRSLLHAAPALVWACTLGCTSDEGHTIDSGSDPVVDDAGLSEGGAWDAGDAYVPARCRPLLDVPAAELVPRYLRGEFEPILYNLVLGRTTSRVTLRVNLSADAGVPEPFDIERPTATSNYNVPLDIYDSLSTSHRLTLYFRRSAGSAWEWHATADGADIVGGRPGTPIEGASGEIWFDAGVLSSAVLIASVWTFPAAAAQQVVEFDFGPTGAEQDGGVPSSTEHPGPFATTLLQQDGSTLGGLQRIEIMPDGLILGFFGDGTRQYLGYCTFDAVLFDGGPPPQSTP